MSAAAIDELCPPEGAAAWVESLAGRIERWVPLEAGAGRRRYWRVRLASGGTRVLMHARPEDPAILPPALRREASPIPFLEVTRLLADHAVPVPTLHGVDLGRSFVLLEDLGSCHLFDLPGAQRLPPLERAVDLIARVHAITGPRKALPFQRRFDLEWIEFEQGLFLNALSPSVRERLRGPLRRLAQAISELPVALSLRDYQSHNLLIDPRGALRVIDYQDALLAPRELDLVSLLHDSYLDLERERGELLKRYERRSARRTDPDALVLLGIQRKSKDLARFVSLLAVRGDGRYGAALIRTRRALHGWLRALPHEHRELAQPLRDAVEELAARAEVSG